MPLEAFRRLRRTSGIGFVTLDRADVVRQCLDVGHEHLAGELAGGIDAWLSTGRSVTAIPMVDVAEMTGAVVDVREANEYASGHVPGTGNIELRDDVTRFIVNVAHLLDGVQDPPPWGDPRITRIVRKYADAYFGPVPD